MNPHPQQLVLDMLKRLKITPSRALQASSRELRSWTPEQVERVFSSLAEDWTTSPIRPVENSARSSGELTFMRLCIPFIFTYRIGQVIYLSSRSFLSGRVGDIKPLLSDFWVGQRAIISSCRYLKAPLSLIRLAARERRALCVNRAGQFSIRQSGYMICSYVWEEIMHWSGSEDDVLAPGMLGLNRAHFDRIFDVVARTGCEWAWLGAPLFPDVILDRGLTVEVLNSLARVYRNADAVVVLDALMLQLVTSDAGDAAAALVCGRWMERLEAFTQTVVAKEVIVLMARGTEIRFSTLISELESKSRENPARYRELHETFRRLRPGEQSVSLVDIACACRNRIAFGDPDAAVQLTFPVLDMQWTHEDRLTEGALEIIRSRLPQAAQLASMRGPRGFQAPYGWAPISLLGLEGNIRSDVKVMPSDELEGEWSAVRVTEVTKMFRGWDGETVVVLNTELEGGATFSGVRIKLAGGIALRKAIALKVIADQRVRKELGEWREAIERKEAWVIWGEEGSKDVLLVSDVKNIHEGDATRKGRVKASGALSEEITGGVRERWLLS